jgi:GWxTD domain-containing protein
MRTCLKTVLLSSLLTAALCSFLFGTQRADPWKTWLREVEPIISKTEKTVFEDLKTEEDRARFVDSFWRVRDPDPATTHNEYKSEYYRRLGYVNRYFGGTRSDRGRIYMILGEPAERNSYSGYEQIVDSEVWIYFGNGRPGLPPVMNLIFYKRENLGDYRLFYPGAETASDILAPGYRYGRESSVGAYNEIRTSYIELADATLSIIPGEGFPGMPATATSSNRVLASIYTLPEREASESYLSRFTALEGLVDVTYSFKEMPGTATLAVSRNRGYSFLNFAVLPEKIQLKKIEQGVNAARFNLNVKIEDELGQTVYQTEKKIEFKLNDIETQELEKKAVMFSGFAPIIPGVFEVQLLLSNSTTEEYLVHEERIDLSEASPPVLLGYKAAETSTDRFMPFSADNHRVSLDPRLIFNKSDALEGLVFTSEKPEVQLLPLEQDRSPVKVQDVTAQGRYYVFKLPLAEIKSDDYYLSVSAGGGEVFRKRIAVLSFVAAKPENYDWSDPPTSGHAYNFEIATQHLNHGDIPAALEYFHKIPEELWNSFTIPYIAKAHYRNGNFPKVLELLEREDVAKDYSVLFMLGNSSLELKELRKAADYFERLRNYGDTVNLNQVLGAIFLSLGEREKAQVYFDRAKMLEKTG